MSNYNDTIIKALHLLDFFTAERPVIGLTELSRLSGYPKANVHRMLSSLLKCGFLSRSNEYDSDRRYVLGIKLFELGMRVYENMELNKIAVPFMKELKNIIDEAVQLVIRDNNEAIYIEKIETDYMFRLYTAKGRRAPLYAGASGRVLLSYLPDSEIHNLLEKSLIKFTDKTPINKDVIWDKIQFARKNGYSVSKEELCPGSMEIAVPIFNSSGKAIASLSTAGPLMRMPETKLHFFVNNLKEYAQKISYQLGFIQN